MRKSEPFPLFETVSGNNTRLQLWSVCTDNSVCVVLPSLNQWKQAAAAQICISGGSPIRSCFLATTNSYSSALRNSTCSCGVLLFLNRSLSAAHLLQSSTLLFAAAVACRSRVCFSCSTKSVSIYSNSSHLCFVWRWIFSILCLCLF